MFVKLSSSEVKCLKNYASLFIYLFFFCCFCSAVGSENIVKTPAKVVRVCLSEKNLSEERKSQEFKSTVHAVLGVVV